MSAQILNDLESRIQQTVTTIQSLQKEISELRQKNLELEQLIDEESASTDFIKQENERLKQEKLDWQNRLNALLGKINEITQ